MTIETYIDPVTLLPHRLGEIYADRDIRVTGAARAPSGALETLGLKIVVPALDGGIAETVIPDGPWSITESLWVQLRRLAGSSAGAAILDPTWRRAAEGWVQLFYKDPISGTFYCKNLAIADSDIYTRIGFGLGQNVYDAIVSDDDTATHSDLQPAINDVAEGGWILVKKIIPVATTVSVPKKLNIIFQGSNAGLISGGATTGLRFSGTSAGSRLQGFGLIQGFSVTGIDLNGISGHRVEMVFASNTANITYGGILYNAINVQGSYNLAENALISTATSDNALPRWNHTLKIWEPAAGATLTYDGILAAITANLGTLNATTGSVGMLTATFASGTLTNTSQWLRAQSVALQTELSGAGPHTINCGLANVWSAETTAGATFNFGNLVNGETIVLRVRSTGAASLVFNFTGGETLRWPGGTIDLAIGAGKTNLYTFVKIQGVGGNNVYVALSKDYIA